MGTSRACDGFDCSDLPAAAGSRRALWQGPYRQGRAAARLGGGISRRPGGAGVWSAGSVFHAARAHGTAIPVLRPPPGMQRQRDCAGSLRSGLCGWAHRAAGAAGLACQVPAAVSTSSGMGVPWIQCPTPQGSGRISAWRPSSSATACNGPNFSGPQAGAGSPGRGSLPPRTNTSSRPPGVNRKIILALCTPMFL